MAPARSLRPVLAMLGAFALVAFGAYAAPSAVSAPPRAPLEASVGSPTSNSVVFYARGEGPGFLAVELRAGDAPPRRFAAPLDSARDFTVRLPIDGLAPDADQTWRAWIAADREVARTGAAPPAGGAAGRFRTPPLADVARPVRLGFGGDLSGQNVCRDAARETPILAAIARRPPDLFVALGDMIYADDVCEAIGRFGNAQVPGPPVATDLAGYRAHWDYARADPGLRALFERTLVEPVWDDHEIANDAGPAEDVRSEPPYTPGRHLLPIALEAFRERQPLPDAAALHRSVRWGRRLELFVLDTRSHRDPNAAPDTAAAPKTMLGAAQRDWLAASLARSDATWKVVVSSVPIAIPTGSPAARDGWASGDGDGGFERELRMIFEALQRAGVRRSVWITTDVHFATVLRHHPFDDDPGFEVIEVVTGPMQAGLFPKAELDPTFRPERLFFHGPPGPNAASDFDDALRYFNFGELAVDADGRLHVEVRGADGAPLFERIFDPS